MQYLLLLKVLSHTLFLLLRNVCDELASGSFVPVAFEKTVADGMPGLVTPEGLRVAVGGTVDRVDEMKLNGKTYVRVIDYKTGSTRFLKEALQNGIGLQMFVYLFSVCGTNRSRLPAGVLYVPSSFAPSMTGYTDGDSSDLVLKRFRRSGLLLSDPDVLAGMEKDLKKIYLPVRLNSDGSFMIRYNLPERRHVFPVVAVSRDGIETKTVVLAFERNTKNLETVIRDQSEEE